MTCEEIIELMQRSLDYELSPLEKGMLDQHVMQCSECSSLYNRLQVLSNQLETLPIVEPPFSIVDSILPTLEEIDRQEAAARVITPMSSPSRKKFWTRSRIAAGAVAASMLIGVYLVNDFVIPNSQDHVVYDTASGNVEPSDDGEGNSEAAVLTSPEDAGDHQSDGGMTALTEEAPEPSMKQEGNGSSAVESGAMAFDPNQPVSSESNPTARSVEPSQAVPTETEAPRSNPDSSEQPSFKGAPEQEVAVADQSGLADKAAFGFAASSASDPFVGVYSPNSIFRAYVENSIIYIQNVETNEMFTSHQIASGHQINFVWESDAVLHFEIVEQTSNEDGSINENLLEVWNMEYDSVANLFTEVKLN